MPVGWITPLGAAVLRRIDLFYIYFFINLIIYLFFLVFFSLVCGHGS
jgi:hypothetical protein